ncbi:hypothetical protein ElyMa_001125700 [Elysia marginata]|uniref:Uncharacterized protein n=1 Tax=Elysia marginata TaxID=1093978 RepID=A0AAV4I0N1_9GAST|nr:hypothetical protein ElyMa_001125700 [Elysia marginata]
MVAPQDKSVHHRARSSFTTHLPHQMRSSTWHTNTTAIDSKFPFWVSRTIITVNQNYSLTGRPPKRQTFVTARNTLAVNNSAMTFPTMTPPVRSTSRSSDQPERESNLSLVVPGHLSPLSSWE